MIPIVRASVPALVVVALAATIDLNSQTSMPRLVVIASDLHLGAGKDAAGQWLPIEDFRWQEDFASFLQAVDDAGKGNADLVLNGDTFELWQSMTDDCRQSDARLGCTEQQALGRLERVLTAHAADVSVLGTFARSGTNRLILVPGDHDAALTFPSLAARAIAALNAPGRVEVASKGYWLSSDGAVYAEHGHQMPDDPYAFASWPAPYLREGDRAYLERSSGERVAQALYNDLEPRFPIVDNFAQEGAGLKYVAAAEPPAVPAASIEPLLMFFLSRPTWQQFRLELDAGEVQPPEWDLEALRRNGPAALAESLLPDDRFRSLIDGALQNGQLSIHPSTLTDTQLVALCDYRAALRRSRRRLERSMTQALTVGRAPSECPRTPATRGSVFDYFWRSRDALFSSRFEQVRGVLARDGRPTQSIKVFALGHTHLPAVAISHSRSGASPVVLNSGAWQRTATPFQIEEAMRDREWSAGDILQRFQPEQLPACYGVIWIDPYTADPAPRFRFWRSDRRWGNLPRDAAGLANACGGGAGPAA